jgi:prepilin-type N-terminal cleavage/methylation domain-containing protein
LASGPGVAAGITEVARGFSLIETLFAMTILTAALVVVAQVAAASTRANQSARSTTLTTILAAQKLEQLRSLAWAFDAAGVPISDISTDTTVAAMPAGGTGLRSSPSGALEQNTVGYCDFLDGDGNMLGGGTSPPAYTAFVRRWSIDSLADVPNDTLVIQVSVIRAGRRADETRLVGIRTRKGR